MKAEDTRFARCARRSGRCGSKTEDRGPYGCQGLRAFIRPGRPNAILKAEIDRWDHDNGGTL